MRQPSSPAVLALALLFLADPRTAGAVLLDPTRPLAGGGREEAAVPKPLEALAAAVAAPQDAASAPAAPPALQSLQVPQQGEATAIVDGQLLKVGGKLGSYEVTHIDAHGLMVRGPSGRERWTLAGVEVLDSRQSAASLKMGPLGEARKPARRASSDAVMPVPEAMQRAPGTAAPSPLVFPLPTPQGQTMPAPRLVPPQEQPPQTAPVPTNPARPTIKQALADAPSWAAVTPMTVAYQPWVQPSPRAQARGKRGANASKGWTASVPSKALRMDLDDMRRKVQMMPTSAKPLGTANSAQRWHRPIGPSPYGAWAAAWATAPASVQRYAAAQSATGLVLARWQPSVSALKPQTAKAGPTRYSPVQGPRPIPASVVWRPTASKVWQPHGANDLPGVDIKQWASTSAPLVRIAALEPRVTPQHSFAQATAKPLSRSWANTRWAQARTANTAQAAGPVTHTYPMALPQWRNAPTAQADNSSSTQVAYALETP